MLKQSAQIIARMLDLSGVLDTLERRQESGRLRVLVYHRIDDPGAEPDLDPGLISATPAEFREQMRLVAMRFNAVSLETVLAAQRGETSLPNGAVLITFDDGYLDFAAHAWPVLKEFNLPAVLFVSSAYPGKVNDPGFWWDRLYAGLRRAGTSRVTLPDLGTFDLAEAGGPKAAHRQCKLYVKSLPHFTAMQWVEDALQSLGEIPPLGRVLDWDRLRHLAREGVAVCAHGHLHALCTRLSAQELETDLQTCQSRLISELGFQHNARVIAWPANAASPEVREIARKAGFTMGFGGVRGVEKLPFQDPLNMQRIPVLRYRESLFRAQMQPGIASLGRYVTDRPWRTVAN